LWSFPTFPVVLYQPALQRNTFGLQFIAV
jgi:hypothetical protein